MIVEIRHTRPFSLVKIANDLKRYLSNYYDVIISTNNYSLPKGDVIIAIGNPDQELFTIIRHSFGKRIIAYTVCEGVLRTPALWFRPYSKIITHVVPSKYVKEKYEAIGVDVDDVIPHAIFNFGEPKKQNNKNFLYIGGYQYRKYPKYGVEAIKRSGIKPCVLTTNNNPYANLFDTIITDYKFDETQIVDYYKKFSWYLNISDCEGFGLTPLEAMAHGMPLISPYYLPIYEYADSSFTIFIPTKDAWYEPFGWENIEHHIYNTDDMVFAIYKALDMSDNQFANMSENALNKAKMYSPDVYKKFVNLIG